jgi:DNA-directed RNA polymerase subunit L
MQDSYYFEGDHTMGGLLLHELNNRVKQVGCVQPQPSKPIMKLTIIPHDIGGKSSENVIRDAVRERQRQLASLAQQLQPYND